MNSINLINTIKLLDALLKRPLLSEKILQHECFDLGTVLNSIFEVFHDNPINNSWSTYLSVLQSLFFLSSDPNQELGSFPVIPLLPEIVNIKYIDLFTKLLDFFCIYSAIPDEYFRQLFEIFINPNINSHIRKSIFHFFKKEKNIYQLISLINQENIVQLIKFEGFEKYPLIKRRLRLIFLIQEIIDFDIFEEIEIINIYKFNFSYYIEQFIPELSEKVLHQYLLKLNNEFRTDEERFSFYEALELYVINHEIKDQKLILDIKKFCQGINLTVDVFKNKQSNNSI